MTSDERAELKHLVGQMMPGSEILYSWHLRGGLSAQMTAIELRHSDGGIRRYVLRRPSRQRAVAEFAMLELLQKLNVRAPGPVWLGEEALVMEWIDGKPDYAPANLTNWSLQTAAELARIHACPVAGLELPLLESSVEALLGSTGPPDESLEEGRIRSLVQQLWPWPQNARSLLHGDFWPGNILWRDDLLKAVVDWEDAVLGDPLADLAIARLDILMLLGLETMNDFTAHYFTYHALDATWLPAWDLWAALRPAGKLDQWAKDWPVLGRPDITEASMRAAHALFRDQAFESLAKLTT